METRYVQQDSPRDDWWKVLRPSHGPASAAQLTLCAPTIPEPAVVAEMHEGIEVGTGVDVHEDGVAAVAELGTELRPDKLELTPRDRFWMNNKPYQFFRFVVPNLKILRAVDHSKRS